MSRAISFWLKCICVLLAAISAESGEILWKHGGHSWDITDLKQSKDGKKMFSACADITVREWAMPEGRYVGSYLGHTNIIRALDVRGDGSLVAAGADGGQVVVWDTATGAVKWQTLAHLYVAALAFSPDGTVLATGGGSSTDPTIKLWAAETGALLGTLTGHTSWVTALAFKPDGKSLVSASVDRSIRLWDVESQLEIDQLLPGRGFIRVAFSPDASELAIASTNLIRFAVGNGWSELPRVGAQLKNLMDVTYSSDGSMLATASVDQKVRWWRKDTGELLHEEIVEGNSTQPGQEAVLFSADGTKLYAGGGNYAITEWNVETGDLLRRVNAIAGAAEDIEFFANGEKLAIVDEARIKVLNANTGEILLDLVETNAGSVAVSPSGTQMLTSGFNKVVELWDTTTGELIKKAPTFVSYKLAGLAFSPDGKQFVGHRSGVIELWDTEALAWIRGFTYIPDTRMELAVFLPDGGTVVTGDDMGFIRWWRISDGTETNSVKAQDTIVGLSLSPDGKFLATSGYTIGEKLRIWDATTGAFVKDLSADGSIARHCFSPDGKMIAAGVHPGFTVDYYFRGELRVWDIASGNVTMSHTNEAARIFNASWSSKGTIVFATGNGSLVAVRAPGATPDGPGVSAKVAGNRMELFVAAPSGAAITLEASTNLQDWETWTQTTGTGAAEKFEVTLAPGGGGQFFRAKQQ